MKEILLCSHVYSGVEGLRRLRAPHPQWTMNGLIIRFYLLYSMTYLERTWPKKWLFKRKITNYVHSNDFDYRILTTVLVCFVLTVAMLPVLYSHCAGEERWMKPSNKQLRSEALRISHKTCQKLSKIVRNGNKSSNLATLN